jgi:hypothetical protein
MLDRFFFMSVGIKILFSHTLHPPFCLQTIGRKGALPNCILSNHLLIKWLKDNHMIVNTLIKKSSATEFNHCIS